MANFGDRLKELRIEKRMTQEELANQFFLNKSSVSRYERNQQVPELELLQKIADFFEVTTDYLLGKSTVKSYEQEKELFNQFKEALEELGMYNEDGLEKLKLAIKLVDAIKKDEKN